MQKYPSYYCQHCGECIGWLGRFFAWAFGREFHNCNNHAALKGQQHDK